jgi:short-subunit dehydrogenase
MASDLKIRYRVQVEIISADVSTPNGYLEDLERVINTMGGIDGIFCPIGAVSEVDDVRYNSTGIEYLTHVNYISVVSVITRLWSFLSQRNHRTVVVGFGSVAAVRGRNFNVGYSAAKRALMSFFESLRHAAASSNVIVQFYVLGYLDTNLAFSRSTLLPRANLEILSRRILANLKRDFGVAYHPRYWYVISCILKMIPWFLFSSNYH